MILFAFTTVVISESKADLKFSKDSLFAGESIKITYQASAKLGDNLFLISYYYLNNNSNVLINQNPIISKNSQVQALEILVPQNAYLAFYKVISLDTINNLIEEDRNFGEFNHKFVYTRPNPTIAENANYYLALSYLSGLEIPLNRKINYDKAISFLQDEIKLYPNNLKAEIGLASLLFDIKKTSKSDFTSKLNILLAKSANVKDDQSTQSIIRSYRILGKDKEAEAIEKQYIIENPKSLLAEQEAYSYLGKIDNFNDFSYYCLKFVKDFPNSKNTKTIIKALIESYISTNNTSKMQEDFKNVLSLDYDSQIIVASELGLNEKVKSDRTYALRIEDAERILNNVLSKSQNEYFASQYDSNSIQSNAEKRIEYNATKGEANREMANILMKQEKYAEAYKFYKESIKFLAAAAEPDILDKIMDTFENVAEKDSNFRKIESQYLFSTFEKLASFVSIDYDLSSYYLSLAKVISQDTLLAKSKIDNIIASTKKKRIENLKYERINSIDLSAMTFKNSEDTFIEMSDLKNKNQVFFFWSSWVESCPNYIPALDSLYNLSKKDSSFEIKCINIWEKQAENSEKIEDFGFLENLPKGLSNLKDETAISGRKLGITGLPTVAIIDKDGKLAFQLSYFKNLDNFLIQILERIEYLKNN